MSKYAVLSRYVTITASNNTIRIKEGSVTEDVTIAVGKWPLRGDGTTDDLGTKFCAALASNTNATNPNTYSLTVTPSIDITAPSASTTIAAATGTSTFQILWAHANTTFDPAILGFDGTNTDDDALDKVSTLSPSALWVANDCMREIEPEQEYISAVSRAQSGRVRAIKRTGPLVSYRLGHDFIDVSRVWDDENTADPNAAFSLFLDATAGGSRFELYTPEVSSGTTLQAPSTSNKVGTSWHWEEGSAASFAPERMEPGMSLYSFDLRLLRHA